MPSILYAWTGEGSGWGVAGRGVIGKEVRQDTHAAWIVYHILDKPACRFSAVKRHRQHNRLDM
jgi:hypothetical protein